MIFPFSATASGSDHWESNRPPQFVHGRNEAFTTASALRVP